MQSQVQSNSLRKKKLTAENTTPGYGIIGLS